VIGLAGRPRLLLGTTSSHVAGANLVAVKTMAAFGEDQLSDA
jgi:hypothetical protein